jgi:hypothetical protein
MRLGWSQFALVSTGFGVVLIVLFLAFMPNVEEFFAREFFLPGMADRYGFQLGTLQATRDGQSYTFPGIVMVHPDGALARMGVRPGDMPVGDHGNGSAALYYALVRGEHGQIAEFAVVNVPDWSAGRDAAAFRTIRVEPPGPAR